MEFGIASVAGITVIYDSEYIDVKALDTLTPANFCVLQDKS